MALGFRAKITGAMLVGSLVPLLAFGLLDFFEFKKEAVETVRHHLATVAERQSVHIADLLDGHLYPRRRAERPLVPEVVARLFREAGLGGERALRQYLQAHALVDQFAAFELIHMGKARLN